MGWLLDQIVLKNSRHPLPAEGGDRRWIENGRQRIECFSWDANSNHGASRSANADLHVVKFVGAAGRAENTSEHPFDFWPDLRGGVSAANPPGYGNSPCKARLELIIPWALRTFDTIVEAHPGVPILLSGNSLGATVAICVAAARQASAAKGLILRDAPQISQVIWQRFGWKSGWLPARWMMQRVPKSLDAVAAASNCPLPAVIVSSGRDRVVPPGVQRLVIDAYQGPKRVVRLRSAGHYDAIAGSELDQYQRALHWLRGFVVGT